MRWLGTFERTITIRVIRLGGVRHRRLPRAGMSPGSGSVSAVQHSFNQSSGHGCGRDRIHRRRCLHTCLECQEESFGNRQDSLLVCFREFPSLETLDDTSLRLDIHDAAIPPGHLTSKGVTHTTVGASAQGGVRHGLVYACVVIVPLMQKCCGWSLCRHESRIQVRRRMWSHAFT